MHIVKPALTLAILMTSLVCTNAWAQQTPPAPLAAEAVAPNKTADKKPSPPPKKPAIKRRAVHQIIDGMPTPAAPPTYGPVLTAPPGAALSAPGMLPSTIPPSMAPPATINRCDAGGCTDNSGARYNGASGTLLSPQGRLCSSNGVVVNCI